MALAQKEYLPSSSQCATQPQIQFLVNYCDMLAEENAKLKERLELMEAWSEGRCDRENEQANQICLLELKDRLVTEKLDKLETWIGRSEGPQFFRYMG